GTSSPSGTFNFTTISVATPTLLSPVANAVNVSRTPTLLWTASAGATSYDVYLGTSASPAFYANVSGTSVKVGPLAAGTKLFWFVVAKNSIGVSPPSATFNFTTTTATNLAHLVFRNGQSGDVAAWLMNGLTLVQGGTITAGLPLAWRIDGIGDLDG